MLQSRNDFCRLLWLAARDSPVSRPAQAARTSRMTTARHQTRGSGAQIPVQPAVRQRLTGARLPRGDRKEEEKEEELRLGFATGVTSDSHGRRPVRRDGRDEEKPVGQERQRPGRFHPQTSSRGRGPGPTCPRRPPLSSARSAAGPRPGIRSPAAPRPRYGPFLPRPMAPVGGGGRPVAQRRRPPPHVSARHSGWRGPAGKGMPSLPAPHGRARQRPLPRQARRTPGTSTWGLHHQRRAAPPARVTSSTGRARGRRGAPLRLG